MARHRSDRRRIKSHRPYTVEELARTLGMCRATIRRWQKDGLPTIDSGKPALIRGADAIEFLAKRAKPKQSCPAGHCYCVKCRTSRPPGAGIAEFMPLTVSTGNLRALCPECGTMMHRRTSLKQLEQIRTTLDVHIVERF